MGAAARLRPGRRRRAGGRARAGGGAEGRIRGAAVQLRRAGRAGGDRAAGADRVPPPDREPDDRGQRSRGGPARRRWDAVPVPRPRAPGAGADRAARGPAGVAGGAHAAAAGTHVPVPGGRARGRDLPRRRALHPQQRARPDRASARSCCVRSSRPTTRPRNIGHAGLHTATYCHFTSRSAATPTSSATARCCPPSASGSRPRARPELGELGEWTSEREREAATIERDADDVARCFLLERLLRREGDGRVFEGEVVGLISAGAFVAFSPEPQPARELPFEGMLPVRILAAAAARRSPAANGRGPRVVRPPREPWVPAAQRRAGVVGAQRAGDDPAGRAQRVEHPPRPAPEGTGGAGRGDPGPRRSRPARARLSCGRWQRARASARSGPATWRQTATPATATTSPIGSRRGSCSRAPRSSRCAPPEPS